MQVLDLIRAIPLSVCLCLSFITSVSTLGNSAYVESDLSNATVVVAVVLCVSCVLLLIGCASLCASLCPRKTEFRGFEHDDAFPELQFPTPPIGDFPMYPPTEDAPERAAIYFDPLPDLAARLRERQQEQMEQQKHIASNMSQIRPKVSHVGRERLDSEEDSRESIRDAAQERVKLDRMLSIVKRANSNVQCSRSQLQYIQEVGTGWFGKVLQAEGQSILPGHKKTRVIVQMLMETASQQDQYAFLQESAPYRDVEHTNVLKIIGCCVETHPYLTIFEYCPNGDLKSYLRSQRNRVEQIDKQGLILNFACDIAAGLQAMHQANYVHRDIALRNCLIMSDLTVKVGDYGLSEVFHKEDYYFDANGDPLPIRWLAPEVISCSFDPSVTVTLRQITKDCNLWSFGVALWELASFGAMPYAELTNDQVLSQVVTDRTAVLLRPELPLSNMQRLYQLMELCWSAPSQRPSLRQLRIMLLHLHSNKDDPDVTDFDRKWNQMMPRSPPGNNVHQTVATIESEDLTYYMDDPRPSHHSFNGLDDFQISLDVDRTNSTGAERLHSSFNSGSHQRYDMTPLTQLHSRPITGPQENVNELSLAAELGDSFNALGGNVSSPMELQSEDDAFSFSDIGRQGAGDCESYGTSDSAVEDGTWKGEYGAQKYDSSDFASTDGAKLKAMSPLIEPIVGAKKAQNILQNSVDVGTGNVRNISRSPEEEGMLESLEETRTKVINVDTSIAVGGSADSTSSEEAAAKGQSPNNEHDDWSFVEHHEYSEAVAQSVSIGSDGNAEKVVDSFTHTN